MDVCLQAAECLKSDTMDENLQVSTETVKAAYTHVTTVNGKSKCALNRRETWLDKLANSAPSGIFMFD